MEVADIAWLLH